MSVLTNMFILNVLSENGIISVILMDLQKAYDCLPHDLLIAKLEAYGLDNGCLNLILHSKLVPLKVNGQKFDGEFLKGQY